MYRRLLKPPAQSFFLFGPRGTGKSTWLKEHFGEARLNINLLKSSEFLKYQRSPSVLADEVAVLKKGDWVVIDEVQKVPALLDEIHALLFERGAQISFALSGSSARKLKKSHANMLAGRALTRKMHSLSCLEMGDAFDLRRALRYGMLPAIQNEMNDAARTDRLDSYVDTYIREEIQQEALVRNLDSFSRFLQVASLMSGNILNLSGVARDVGVSRSTVQGYFEILQDTLLGWSLPSYRLKAKVKEISHPKFYFFDGGVQRALLGEHRNELGHVEAGHQFEAYVLNEIRNLNSSLGIGADMSYWRTEAGTEVDLIWQRGKKKIGIEIKHTDSWKRQYNSGLATLLEEKKIDQAFGIYIGKNPLKQGSVTVFPYLEALRKIMTGEIGFDP